MEQSDFEDMFRGIYEEQIKNMETFPQEIQNEIRKELKKAWENAEKWIKEQTEVEKKTEND